LRTIAIEEGLFAQGGGGHKAETKMKKFKYEFNKIEKIIKGFIIDTK